MWKYRYIIVPIEDTGDHDLGVCMGTNDQNLAETLADGGDFAVIDVVNGKQVWAAGNHAEVAEYKP